MTRFRLAMAAAGVVAIAIVILAQSWLAAMGAGGLLHPNRRSSVGQPPDTCDMALFDSVGVRLKGWQCRGAGDRRAIVYLHGIADNRSSATGVIERFARRGFDVIAYDSRAHGESEGDACT